jgi:hypothetical protein
VCRFFKKVKSAEQITSIVVPIKKIHTQTVSTPMTLRHTFFCTYIRVYIVKKTEGKANMVMVKK